jgi:hypothetical protein
MCCRWLKPDQIIRLVVIAVSASMFLRYWALWRTRNLPAAQGGTRGNVFNDRELYDCIYKGDTTCITAEDGTVIEPRHLQTFQPAGRPWFWYLLALVTVVVCGTLPGFAMLCFAFVTSVYSR